VIGIIQVGGQAAADRYAYLTTIPFYLMIGVAFSYLLCGRVPLPGLARASVALLLVGVTGLLVGLTREQTRYWHDDIAFWERAAVFAPRYFLVNLGLGTSYAAAEDYEASIRAFETLVEGNPGNYKNRLYLADVYRWEGRFAEALDTLDPVAEELKEHREHRIYAVIAEHSCHERRYPEAERAVEAALQLDPRDSQVVALARRIRARSCR
jgi:tetratricopeptide (TPR) repeat protein